MKTFTHILGSINWIDVAMLILLVRVIFIGAKSGFVTEFFKLSGVLSAVFIGLHYYLLLSAFVSKKTNWPLEALEWVFFVLLVCLMVLVVKFLRDSFLVLFKFETTHAGFNQWGAGVLSIARALLLASLIMYGILLTRVESLQRQVLTCVSHKLALKAASNTYSFLYHNFVGKIFIQEKFNEDVFNVISRSSMDRKP